MSAIITVEFTVPVGYEQGDWAQLHSNDGDGDIDWENPISDEIFGLFPSGAGIYGWGHAPWGHFPWGYAYSMRTAGWGHLPWGHFPWGRGSAVISARHKVSDCGFYEFGFACYDQFGNAYSDSAEEISLDIHIAPPAPGGLKKNSYNKTTDVLVLDVA